MAGERFIFFKADKRSMTNAQKVFNKSVAVFQNVIKESVKDLALEIETAAKLKCPVDTNRLRGSISSDMAGEFQAVAGTNVEYAPYVEYGTKKASAQPFFEPAILEAQKKAWKILNDNAKEALRQLEAAMK